MNGHRTYTASLISHASHAFAEHHADLGEAQMNYARLGDPGSPAPLLIPGQSESRRSYGGYSCLTMSTEISTAGIVPLFSSQCVVFASSGQPRPGP